MIKIQKGKEAPIISSISYMHHIKREDGSIGDYLMIEYLDKSLETQLLNVETKIDVNALDKTIVLTPIEGTDIVPIYDINEQEGFIQNMI